MSIFKDLMTVIMFFALLYYSINYLMLKSRHEKLMKHFTDALVHDLRTPVLAQLRGAELLQKGAMGALNSCQSEFTAQIEESCRYTLNMISMLLKTYSPERGKWGKWGKWGKVLTEETFSMPEILTECFEEVLPIAKEKQLEFVYDGSNINTLIKADRADIKTVISHLLRNAVLYSDKNEKIFVTLCKKSNRLTIDIKNKSALLSSKSSRVKLYAPIGENIGLYLSKKIAKSCKGTLSAFREGKNTGRFIFTLPSY